VLEAVCREEESLYLWGKSSPSMFHILLDEPAYTPSTWLRGPENVIPLLPQRAA
jgi:hypothetical protein